MTVVDRHELLWIYDMFNSHDEEHCGFLGEFEVRRLMKYMGTSARRWPDMAWSLPGEKHRKPVMNVISAQLWDVRSGTLLSPFCTREARLKWCGLSLRSDTKSQGGNTWCGFLG